MIKDPYIGMPIKLNSGHMQSCCNAENTNPNLDWDSISLNDLPLAMSYVPFQRWQNIYPLEKALKRGTMFADLDLPFKGGMKHE